MLEFLRFCVIRRNGAAVLSRKIGFANPTPLRHKKALAAQAANITANEVSNITDLLGQIYIMFLR